MREGTEGGEGEGRKEINVLTQNALRLSLSSSAARAAAAPSLQPFAGSADVTAGGGGGVHAPADRVHDAIDAVAAGEVGDRGNRSPMPNS